MGKVTEVPDLVNIEEDLRTKERALNVFPPFCMELFAEGL